jgi:hypothetical protein
VAEHRAAGITHHCACDVRDYLTLDAAVERMRTLSEFLRARDWQELNYPLTLEWATEGRDAQEHEH